MKKSIKFLLLSVTLLGGLTDVAIAETRDEAIQKLSEQSAALQKKMEALQAQLATMKEEQVALRASTTQSAATTQQASIPNPDTEADPGFEGLTAKDYYEIIGGMPVVTSPDIDERPQYAGGHLIVNLPTVGTDLDLLRYQQKFESRLRELKRALPDRPRLGISGVLEAEASAAVGYDDEFSSDINLSLAEIHFLMNLNRWITGYMTIEYNDGRGATSRILNSNIFLGRAFINVGNLDITPFYATIGQEYVTFGHYSSWMITDSTAKTMGRTKARALTLGFAQQENKGFSGQVFAFKGESKVSGSNSIDTFGANLSWAFVRNKFSNKVGVSFISNVANALGQQANGVSNSANFQGFAISGQSLKHRVPAINIRDRVSVGEHFALIGEYVGSLRDYSSSDMSFNNSGARPSALHLEGAFFFDFWERPGSLAIGYDHTWEALALNLPEDRWSTTASYSIWQDTVLAIEYRHDSNYSNNDSASGQGLAVSTEDLGRSSDTLTAKFDIFF